MLKSKGRCHSDRPRPIGRTLHADISVSFSMQVLSQIERNLKGLWMYHPISPNDGSMHIDKSGKRYRPTSRLSNHWGRPSRASAAWRLADEHNTSKAFHPTGRSTYRQET